ESHAQKETILNRKESEPCTQTPSDFTAFSERHPKKFTRPFSIPTRCPNGFRQTDSPPRRTRWTPKLAALTKCHSRISRRAKVIPSAGRTLNWLRTNGFATPTNSTIRICLAKYRRPSH